jgi:hypothetical protein
MLQPFISVDHLSSSTAFCTLASIRFLRQLTSNYIRLTSATIASPLSTWHRNRHRRDRPTALLGGLRRTDDEGHPACRSFAFPFAVGVSVGGLYAWRVTGRLSRKRYRRHRLQNDVSATVNLLSLTAIHSGRTHTVSGSAFSVCISPQVDRLNSHSAAVSQSSDYVAITILDHA